QVAAEFLGEAADFFHRLAHGQVALYAEAALLQLRHALVEDFARALFLLLQQLLGQEALGEEHAGWHAGHRQQVRVRLGESGYFTAGKQGALAVSRAVIGHQDTSEHGCLLSGLAKRNGQLGKRNATALRPGCGGEAALRVQGPRGPSSRPSPTERFFMAPPSINRTRCPPPAPRPFPAAGKAFVVVGQTFAAAT